MVVHKKGIFMSKKILFFKIASYIVFLFSSASMSFSATLEKIVSSGLDGKTKMAIHIFNGKGKQAWLGEVGGIFWKDLASGKAWEKISIPDLQAESKVRQIIFLYPYNKGYAATSKGLFEIHLLEKRAKKIYSSSLDAENDCYGIAASDENIFVATKGGLFKRSLKGGRWIKCSLGLEAERVDYIQAAGWRIFAAGMQGVYCSNNEGRTWERRLSFTSENEYQDEESGTEEEEPGEGIHVIALPKDFSAVFVTAPTGIFVSYDYGFSWSKMSSFGLNSRSIRDLKISGTGEIIAVTKTGVFLFKDDSWGLLFPLFDCKSLDLIENSIFVLTASDLYSFSLGSNKQTLKENSIILTNEEPNIQEVQRMVIAYCDVSNNKIETWRHQSHMKAIMPDLSFSYGNNVYGTYNGIFSVGPNDWQVNVSWDLADLVYSSDQTSIDSRSRLNVQMRNDVLAEATQLYFERKRLLTELAGDSQNQKKIQIRVEEVTALLDRLTGGSFSKALESPK